MENLDKLFCETSELPLLCRHESKFIQEIVKQIASKLNRTVLNVASHPVGIDVRVRNIDSWLQDGSTDVGVLEIYGIGGIGKTAIAKTAYNQNLRSLTVALPCKY